MTFASWQHSAWPGVSVIIPTLNQARNLPYVFARLPSDIHEIIVVDGHSAPKACPGLGHHKPCLNP